MSEITPDRRARINRLKKIIVISNFTILFIAILASIILLARVVSLSHQVDTLEAALVKERQSGEQKDADVTDHENVSQNDGENKADEAQKPTEEEDTEQPEETKTAAEIEAEYDRIAYLTFDDGPSENTQAILDILDRYNVKATFFVNGRDGSENEKRYRAIAERGNALGLHSYTHIFSDVYKSLDSFSSDTERIHDFLYDITGQDIKLYRFPGGSSTTKTTNMEQYIEYLNGNGYTYFDWNVSSGDAVEVQLPAEDIVNNVMNGVNGKDRAIVLMHDSSLKDTTVEALPVIIEKLLEGGYAVLPIADSTPPVHHTVN